MLLEHISVLQNSQSSGVVSRKRDEKAAFVVCLETDQIALLKIDVHAVGRWTQLLGTFPHHPSFVCWTFWSFCDQ